MAIAEYTHRAYQTRLKANSLLEWSKTNPAYFEYCNFVDELREAAAAP